MKLRSVRIENHSRLQDAAIDVRGHLVLVGPNDVGKSSLLRCLDLLLGAGTAQLYSRISVADFRDSEQPLVVEAALDSFNDQDKALFPDEIVVDSSTGFSLLTIRLEATIDASETLDVHRTAPGGGTGRQVSRSQLIGLGWKMIGANSRARDLHEDRNSSLDDILRSIDLGEEKVDFDNLTAQLQQKLADSAVLDGLRGQLAGQLSRALPDAVGKEDLTFIPGASATNDVLSDVRLQVNRHGATHNLSNRNETTNPPNSASSQVRGLRIAKNGLVISFRLLSQQSDGTRALFAIALYDLVSESANIVAIDEPEIHLHPTSQRSLARLLQDGDNQKIIATHSADIVGAFPHESIVTVKPGGHLVQPQSGFLSNEERMVAHWWVRDRLEPLTASRIVAVEGVSDRIILQKAAALTGRELDRLGVSVVETGGAGDMGVILKLFGPTGFQIDMSLLIDEDAIDKIAKNFGGDVSALNDHSVWVSRQDLEEEYVTALGANAVWESVLLSGLFSENELKNCNTTGPSGARAETDVAAFCRFRSSYKVRSAMVVAELLTEESARKIVSIESLLAELGAGS